MKLNLRKFLQERVYGFTYALELIVAFFIIIAIVISLIKAGADLAGLWTALDDQTAFRSYLEVVFDIVIGIEFIKMLCRHDLSSVVEVLLFAIARQMIVEHMPMNQGLIGIIAISILFAIRKWLYIEKDNKHAI